MSNFERALEMMDKRWLDSLVEAKDYVPSKKHQRAMNRIFDKMRGDKYHRFTRRTVALLVAAAILLFAATAVVANEASRNFIIEKFKQYSIYSVEVDRFNNNLVEYIEYEKGIQNFFVQKESIDTKLYFDTEEYDFKKINHNNIEYIIFNSKNNVIGIIWNVNKYEYELEGENVSENELLKIAQSTK